MPEERFLSISFAVSSAMFALFWQGFFSTGPKGHNAELPLSAPRPGCCWGRAPLITLCSVSSSIQVTEEQCRRSLAEYCHVFHCTYNSWDFPLSIIKRNIPFPGYSSPQCWTIMILQIKVRLYETFCLCSVFGHYYQFVDKTRNPKQLAMTSSKCCP